MAAPSKLGYYASHPKKYSEYLLLQKAKDPDIVKANQAKGDLLFQNEGFLLRAIHSWLKPQTSYLHSLILQDARLAFLKAIENYDLSRDISIRTFARYHLMKVREGLFKKKQLHEELHEQYTDEVTFQPKMKEEYRDIREVFRNAINLLNSSQREVIQLRFYHGIKGREISILRGCSEARVSFLIKSALQELKVSLVTKEIQPGFFDFN